MMKGTITFMSVAGIRDRLIKMVGELVQRVFMQSVKIFRDHTETWDYCGLNGKMGR